MIQYKFVTVWRMAAPIEAVWEAIYRSETWPAWWESVRRVVEVARGDDDGIGNVRAAVGNFGDQPIAHYHRAVELRISGDDTGVGQDQLDAHAGTPTEFPERATSWMRVASASRTETSWKMPTIAAPASRR